MKKRERLIKKNINEDGSFLNKAYARDFYGHL